MHSDLIARVLPTKVQGGRTIGTGYPITRDLVMTARHVVIFKGINPKVPITIEWPDLKDDTGKLCSSTVSEIIEFGEQYDIALLKCELPLKAHNSLPNLRQHFPLPHENWESLGYPRIGRDEGVRNKVSALGKFHPSDNTHQIQLTSESDAIEKQGWYGISGAPVFNGNTLYAVISKTPTDRKECFTAVLIPWLIINLPAFSSAIGFSDNSHYIIEQKQQIKDLLFEVPDTKLFQELVAKLFLMQGTATPEDVYCKLCKNFEDDPMKVFDVLLQASVDTLKQDASELMLESIHDLFCLFASLTVPKTLATKEAVIRLLVYTKIATEVYVAAQYNTNPIYSSGQDDIGGKYADDASVFTRETGWGVEDFVNEAIKVNALKVLKKDIKDPANLFERQRLNTTIRQRQNKSFNQVHRFELNCSVEENKKNPLYDPIYCRALNAPGCLPDLPIVHYGEVGSTEEADLCAKIEEFILLLKKYGYEI